MTRVNEPDFRASEWTKTTHNGKVIWMSVCEEFVPESGRWEGFVSITEKEPRMKVATVVLTTDTEFKDGFVRCACGWKHELGDGFNQYWINVCPSCAPGLETRTQTKVTTGRPGNYEIKHGHFVYFALSNGIQVQYSGSTIRTESRQRIPQ